VKSSDHFGVLSIELVDELFFAFNLRIELRFSLFSSKKCLLKRILNLLESLFLLKSVSFFPD
jgi:hypothetical protein